MKAHLEVEETEQLEDAATCLRDKLSIKLLAKLGCRVSEALALGVEDRDFGQGMVTIQHLKTRTRLSCPKCRASLSKRHRFCPECGEEVGGVAMQQQEHRRVRTLPLDGDSLDMLADFVLVYLSYKMPE